MNSLYYLLNFVIAGFILFLLKKDLEKIKLKLYNEINQKIWIKLYAMISIVLIHLTWIYLVLFTSYKDETLIFAFPNYLLLSYTIYIYAQFFDKSVDTIASEKISKILNLMITIYLIIISIIICIPNDIKIYLFSNIMVILGNICTALKIN
jgi:hypothetical protein